MEIQIWYKSSAIHYQPNALCLIVIVTISILLSIITIVIIVLIVSIVAIMLIGV